MIFLIIVLFFSILFLASHIILVRNRKKFKDFNGPKGIPVFGNLFHFGSNTLENFHRLVKLHENYKGTCRMLMGPIPILLISESKIVEYFLTSTKHITKTFEYEQLKPWLGAGLLLSTGNKWKQRRKIITPAFHFNILEQFIDVFNSSSKTFVKQVAKECTGKDFNIYPYVALNALDIICETAMGTSVNAQINSESQYVTAVHDMGNVFVRRLYASVKMFDTYFRFTSDKKIQDRVLKTLHNMTETVIKSRRAEWEQLKIKNNNQENIQYNYGKRKKLAFLDMLLDSKIDGKPLSDADIREEVDTFMFEGHDTISSAVSFTLYALAKHPEIQNNVFKEMLEIFGNEKERNATSTDLQNMKYLELVIKESMRLYPPVPVLARYTQDEIHIENYNIPKHVNVYIGIFMLHRNPKYFPEPEKFNPERFIENEQNPYAYIPFSAGPRNCIGQKFAMLELKTTLCHLIRTYEFFPAEHENDIILNPTLTLNSNNGVHVKIKPRIYL